jgi:hypothetical protein
VRNDKSDAERALGWQPLFFMIGQDSRGNWVVQDQDGVRGGLFVDRAEALKFARSENGNRAPTVVTVLETFELNINRRSDPFSHPAGSGWDQRRVA